MNAEQHFNTRESITVEPGFVGPPFHVFDYQRRILPILLGWGVVSVLSGLRRWRSSNDFTRGLGMQFAGWGGIDSLIALFGFQNAARNARRLENGLMSRQEHNEQARRFERVLWANGALDVMYVLGGGWLARRQPSDDFRRGTGWGIVLQGLFLLVFDVVNALLVRSKRAPNV